MTSIQEANFEDDQPVSEAARSRWRENHGNLLLAFVGVIALVGSSVLIYRQNRFVPPRFPDEGNIVVPGGDGSNSDLQSRHEERLTIRVTGAANDSGTIKIAIYEDAETFNDPDRAFATNSLPLNDGEATWEVPVSSLPEQFAVAVYHDENDDEQLTLNRFSFPSERYGFSNNARGLSGPPGFYESVIPRPGGYTTLDLFVR